MTAPLSGERATTPPTFVWREFEEWPRCSCGEQVHADTVMCIAWCSNDKCAHFEKHYKFEVERATTPEHTHCWHSWGSGSGSIGSDGASHVSGRNRCCHCGDVQAYSWTIRAHDAPKHGPYYSEILQEPA